MLKQLYREVPLETQKSGSEQAFQVIKSYFNDRTAPVNALEILEKELVALRRVADAAEKLEQHWKGERAHFACGGEAILLEALAEWRNR